MRQSRGRGSQGSSRHHLRVVVGVHAVKEVLKVRPRVVREAWIRSGWQDSKELESLRSRFKELSIPVVEKGRSHLEGLCSAHQGVALFVDGAPELNWSELQDPGPIVLITADSVEDPQNLGALLRSAWLLGVKGVLVPSRRQSLLTATVSKVSRGGGEHVPLDVHTQLVDPLKRLKKMGFWVYGLAEGGAASLWDLKIPERVVWVVGGEQHGLRKNVANECDELVTIPHSGAPGLSFNLSVATAIALAETFRQRNSKK